MLVEKMGQLPQELVEEASKSCDGQMPDLSMFGGNGGVGAGGNDDDDDDDTHIDRNNLEPECIIS